MTKTVRNQMVHKQISFKGDVLHNFALLNYDFSDILNNLLLVVIGFALQGYFNSSIFLLKGEQIKCRTYQNRCGYPKNPVAVHPGRPAVH